MDWTALVERWPVWLVATLLVWAAWIDGRELRVPNWLTFPMVLAGLMYNFAAGGFGGLGFALLGMVVGLLCLMPLYAVGGMGAGDVKLMAGLGAWLGWQVTAYSFVATVVVGAVMAVAMVVYRRAAVKHYANALMILREWLTIRDPRALSQIAAARKPTMLLLPYGIPICIGSIGYFMYAGLMY
ncbi:MAG: A24 family peptidase [Planctomycetota bacterium]|nr:prepilin peptidase [Planctomycetaceae bacterium]MDQ3332175.1 A24 family peptidase [Planctomycetota bacterium]